MQAKHFVFLRMFISPVPTARIFDDNIYQVRKRLGAQLAIEHPAKADFVMGIPDSGNYAALGYAQQLNMPFEMGMSATITSGAPLSSRPNFCANSGYVLN